MHHKRRRFLAALLALILSLSTQLTAVATEVETSSTEPTDKTSAQENVSLATDQQPIIASDEAADYECCSYIWEGCIFAYRDEDRFEYVYPIDGQTYLMKQASMFKVVIDDVRYPAYCIEPPVAADDSNRMDGIIVGSDTAWATLTENQKQAVGLAILYGYPNGFSSTDTEIAAQMQAATQAIVWEICIGMREATGSYEVTDGRMRQMFADGGLYGNSATGEYKYVYLVDDYYDIIDEALRTHNTIPSFASEFLNFAQTYTMKEAGNGKWSLPLTDTNGILSRYTFTDTDDLHFSVSGDQLTVTADAGFDGAVSVYGTKKVPSVSKQVFILWEGYADKSAQKMIAAYGPVTEDPVPAYFRLTTPGYAEILKETNTGSSVSGWGFTIYGDSECTQEVAQIQTGESGSAAIHLPQGTYYVRETSCPETAAEQDWIWDEEVKEVCVTAGQTTRVTFRNELLGQISILKTDPYGTTLAGAEFLLEWSQDGTFWEPVCYAPELVQQGTCRSADLTDSGTLITGEDGLVTFEGLSCGVLYRLTEVKCPNGFILLTDPIYSGKLDPAESPVLALTVVNAPIYMLPQTGSTGALRLSAAAALCLVLCLTMLFCIRKK